MSLPFTRRAQAINRGLRPLNDSQVQPLLPLVTLKD